MEEAEAEEDGTFRLYRICPFRLALSSERTNGMFVTIQVENATPSSHLGQVGPPSCSAQYATVRKASTGVGAV